MSCSCKSCKPSCAEQNLADCPFESKSGQLVVRDDNCTERRLLGSNGIIIVDDDSFATVSDGSEKQGQIPLNPPDAAALDAITGISNGALFQMGQDAPEASVLQKSGSQLVFKNLTNPRNTYDPLELRKGTGHLGAFICGPNGTVTLGTYDGCANGVLTFDADKNPVCLSLEAFALSLLVPICTQVIKVPDTETYKGTLICTENGVRLQTSPNADVWLSPPQLIYSQNKQWPGHSLSPGSEVAYFPPVSVTNGYFESETVDVDLTTITGYDVRAKTVMINIMLGGYGGAGSFDMVMVVEGMEYARALLGESISTDSAYNQIEVPIPANKKIRVQAVRQDDSGVSSGNELAVCMVYLQAFRF